MATNPRALVAFFRYALPGLVAGGCLGALLGLLVIQIAPSIFVASVVMFHRPGSGLSDSGRDFIANTLNDAGFYRALATNNNWDANEVQEIAANLSVAAKDASRPTAELSLRGTREATLAAALDVVAEEIVAFHRAKQQSNLQWMLDELNASLASASAQLRELEAPDRHQSSATKSALSIATRLTQRRREAELAPRYRLQVESNYEERRRRQSLRAIAKAEAQQSKKIAADPVVSAQFAQARHLANAIAQKQALEQTQQRLDKEFAAVEPLQILRRNAATRQPREITFELFLATASGGFVGLLIGGFIWSRQKTAPNFLHPPLIEKFLRMPVVGTMADAMSVFGEREHKVLASVHPEHFAIAAIHSLRVALEVLESRSDRAGPVVVCELGKPRYAAHLVANLALNAAAAGERVLVLGAAKSTVLTTLFTNEDKALRITHLDAKSLTTERAGNNGTKVHFIVDDSASDATLAAFAQGDEARPHFDTLLIHIVDSATTRRWLKALDPAVKLLVCANDTTLPSLRKAPTKLFDGLVLCGHLIDESAYQGGSELS